MTNSVSVGILILFLLSLNVFGYPSPDTNSISPSLSGIGDMINNLFKSKTPIKDYPDSGRTTVVLGLQSKESIPVQIDDKYGKIQEFAANIFNPKPIVDMTNEHEKYGNDGGTGRKVASTIVEGFESISNGLNAAAEFPFMVSKNIGKKITTSLNIVGGKLVGLAK